MLSPSKWIKKEYLEGFPEIKLLLRGDSGFATPGLYKQCEENGTGYVIRLKENAILRDKASYIIDELDEITKNNKVDYAVVYGEFMYQAGPWPYERRVVCKVKKPKNKWLTCIHSLLQTWSHPLNILSSSIAKEAWCKTS